MREVYAHLEVWLYRSLFVSFFLPAKIQTLFLILCCVWLVINAIQQKIFLHQSEFIAAVFLGAGYLFYLAYLPLTPSASILILYSLLERKISILILPFMVPLMYRLSSKSIFKEIHWFVFGNCLHGILVNAVILYRMLQPSKSLSGHVAYRLNFESISGVHPTYYGMFICLSIAIILFDKGLVKLKRPYWISAQLLLLLFMLLLTPKISLIVLLILYSYFFFFVLSLQSVQKLILLSVATAVGIASYFLLPFFHDRIAEVFTYFSKSDPNAAENSLHFRRLIWEIDVNILKDSWLFGIGPVKLQQYLDMAYFKVSVISQQIIVSYNTHSEYLNQWICFGLGGFLYFISTFVIHIKKALLQTNVLYLSFMLIVMISCLTENILSRQSGILFVALFSALFYFSNNLFKKTIE